MLIHLTVIDKKTYQSQTLKMTNRSSRHPRHTSNTLQEEYTTHPLSLSEKIALLPQFFQSHGMAVWDRLLTIPSDEVEAATSKADETFSQLVLPCLGCTMDDLDCIDFAGLVDRMEEYPIALVNSGGTGVYREVILRRLLDIMLAIAKESTMAYYDEDPR
jgi:hypothetical protein